MDRGQKTLFAVNIGHIKMAEILKIDLINLAA